LGGAYSKYETGDREPSITVLNRLADFYDVSVDYLLGRDVTEIKALTEYEQELIAVSRNSNDWVRACVIGIIKVMNHTSRDGSL
jgi:transcriptional regulator with XRE-family HTH domain